MNFNEAYNKVVEKLGEWIDALIIMLPNAAVALLVIVIFYILARIFKNFSLKILNRLSSHLAINRLISKITSITIATIGFFIALSILKLDEAVVSLLAGVGILGIALGFAFQDMGANFISGIAIAIREPFKLHDIIESNSFFGTVRKISLRTTDILTPQGQIVMIPNKDIFQKPLINYSITGERRIDLKIGISYGDDLQKVKKIAVEAIKDIPNQMNEKNIEFYYEEFSDSSINFVLRVWIKYSAQREYKRAVSEIIEKVKKAFDENDITIPFPIRTLDFGIKGGEKLSDVLEKFEVKRKGS